MVEKKKINATCYESYILVSIKGKIESEMWN